MKLERHGNIKIDIASENHYIVKNTEVFIYKIIDNFKSIYYEVMPANYAYPSVKLPFYDTELDRLV